MLSVFVNQKGWLQHYKANPRAATTAGTIKKRRKASIFLIPKHEEQKSIGK
jgi:hypothetical protein